MHIIEFNKVSKHYNKLSSALKKVSFSISPAEFVAFSGPSGSGKTTILNLAAGLDQPSSGKVFLLGHELQKLNSSERSFLRKRKVGFVFQNFNLFPILTVLENVEYSLALNDVNTSLRNKLSLEALELVGLRALARRFPSQLSGGQQQRVAVARAVVGQPSVIFADEPTANLDSQNAVQLLDLFQRLNKEQKITFVFSSHDPLILKHAKRILKLSDGEITHDITSNIPTQRQEIPKESPLDVPKDISMFKDAPLRPILNHLERKISTRF